MFICGCRSFGDQHKDKDGSYIKTCSTPKRWKRRKLFSKFIDKDKINKNPYAERGLDKFSALLADLDNRKQKIYTQMGSEDISSIQFEYSSDSKHVKPIVVKVQNKHNDIKHAPSITITTSTTNHAAANAFDKSLDKIPEKGETVSPQKQKEKLVKKYLRMNGFPATLVLILLFLAIYGRSFAIFCMLIVWYLVPGTVGGSSSSSSRRKQKRKITEKNILQTERPHSSRSGGF